MIHKALIEQTKCRFREFRREPSAMFWVMFMPVMWMLVLGFAFGGERSQRFAVGYNEAAAPQDEVMIQVLHALDVHPDVVLRAGDEADILRWLRRGEIVLELRGNHDQLVYAYDPGHPEARQAAIVVNDIAQSALGRVDAIATAKALPALLAPRYVDFLIPGLLGLSIMTSSLFGVGMTIVANRRENLLKRFLCTPMPPSFYIVSHMFGRLLVLGFEVIVVLVAGGLFFAFLVGFDALPLFLLVCALGAACFTALGILCASRTKSLPLISGVTNLISLPMMMLSGVFFSKTNFPDTMLPWIEKLPLTALVDGLRKVALEGAAIQDIGREMLVLLAVTVVAGVWARIAFRWH